MTRLAVVALVSAVSALAACTGTDTGNPPVIGFGNSGCKKGTSSALQSVDKGTPDPRYEGLTCLTWQHVDQQTVQIDLTNYEAGCEADKGWRPEAQLRADGGLDIVLRDDDCSQAKCGWCIYDLSFTVRSGEVVADARHRAVADLAQFLGVRHRTLPGVGHAAHLEGAIPDAWHFLSSYSHPEKEAS